MLGFAQRKRCQNLGTAINDAWDSTMPEMLATFRISLPLNRGVGLSRFPRHLLRRRQL